MADAGSSTSTRILAIATERQVEEFSSTASTVARRAATWRRRKIDNTKVESVIVQTLESQLPNATHWSTRSLARRSGISTSSVGRIWRAFGLQPHRLETFELSSDPLFVDKVRDIVGVYLNPPDHALVLCV